jgi:hypothetical protein
MAEAMAEPEREHLDAALAAAPDDDLVYEPQPCRTPAFGRWIWSQAYDSFLRSV